MELIQKQIEIAEGQSAAGDVELGYRLMGNAHEDVLTAFEATLKTVYGYLAKLSARSGVRRDIGSEFQNVEKAKKRFSELGVDLFLRVSESDMSLLRENIQKRYVIGHNLSIADDRFLRLAQTDSSYQPGESVEVLGADIGRFAGICLAVVGGLEDSLILE